MACFRLVTFLPLRPDFSLPCFIARISLSTSAPEEGEYLRPDDFLELDFFAADFFLVAFFVVITILLGGQMAPVLGQVVCGGFAERIDLPHPVDDAEPTDFSAMVSIPSCVRTR